MRLPLVEVKVPLCIIKSLVTLIVGALAEAVAPPELVPLPMYKSLVTVRVWLAPVHITCAEELLG